VAGTSATGGIGLARARAVAGTSATGGIGPARARAVARRPATGANADRTSALVSTVTARSGPAAHETRFAPLARATLMAAAHAPCGELPCCRRVAPASAARSAAALAR
jgi:hypothetical protein